MTSSETQSRVGRFIRTYDNFLSTFVIGAAGLIATSIWQYKQSEIARHQAESQQAIAETLADNQWRIKRAEILGKNLDVLASHGAASADDRYGLLLSLTRGGLLDPELTVSYALELGNDNAAYMKSVLSSTADKDYEQLSHGFIVTCTERYGLTRVVDLCKGDASAGRSEAIAELVGDDTEAWALSPPVAGEVRARTPVQPLADEDRVQKDPARLAWLYTPAITSLLEKGQWAELRRIEAFSAGAHLVTALVVVRARTGLAATDAGEERWLTAYLVGRDCDDDCRARVADYLLTGLGDAEEDSVALLRLLLERPPAESGAAIEKMQARFTRCQVTGADAAAFRDRVLLPALADVLGRPKPDTALLRDLLGLLATVEHRAAAEAQARSSPASLRALSFCNAVDPDDEPPVP